jgi:hypothetical protein
MIEERIKLDCVVFRVRVVEFSYMILKNSLFSCFNDTSANEV